MNLIKQKLNYTLYGYIDIMDSQFCTQSWQDPHPEADKLVQLISEAITIIAKSELTRANFLIEEHVARLLKKGGK